MSFRRCPICNCEPRKSLSVSEVAAGLGSCEKTIRRWILEGKLPATKYNPPRGAWHIRHEDVDALVRKGDAAELDAH